MNKSTNTTVLDYFGFDTVSSLLDFIVENGIARSRVEEYLNSRLRNSSDSWYAKETAGSDSEIAERKLAEWVAGRGLNVFADAVSDVASGLLSLAVLDDNRPEPDEDADSRHQPEPPHVEVIAISKELHFPAGRHYNGGILIFGANPRVPGCGCMQPKGSEVFGRGGEIGLRSIGIMLDNDLCNPELILLLPHPNYRTGRIEETRLGFAAITIDTEGSTSGTAIDYRPIADPVELALGRVSSDEVLSASSSSSGINAALRFPGSEKYLVDHISHLGEYLRDAAAKLSGQHEH